MRHIIQNTIAWNRNAIRRSRRMAERAKTPVQRKLHENNIARFERNIDRLNAA